MKRREISPAELSGNVFDRISRQWMLIAAGTEEKFNFLTASWGSMGMLWYKPIATIYVRESRYTNEFLDREDRFCLSFLKEGNRDPLLVAGQKSGRECDKIKETGLTPAFVDGLPSFEEADVVVICKKMYAQRLDPATMLDEGARQRVYGEDTAEHLMYIAEIEKIYVNE